MSIQEICNKYDIENYTINEDGSIDVDGKVNIINSTLEKLPLNFNKVTGYFNCENNLLTTLEGCPKEVEFYFSCRDNKLTSLEGGPKKVLNNYNCSGNLLTTLKGCPEYVGGGTFNCSWNNLTDLDFIPVFIKRKFYCDNNPIASISNQMYLDFLKAFKSFKVIKDDIVNLKRLKYIMEMFDKRIDLKEIEKYYTIK